MSNEKKGKNESKRCVLAFGETTGHAHAFYANDEGDVAVLDGSTLTIKQNNAELKHEEHTKHVFEPGIGEVIIQREYRMGSLKRVID